MPFEVNVWSYPHGICTDFSVQPFIGCVLNCIKCVNSGNITIKIKSGVSLLHRKKTCYLAGLLVSYSSTISTISGIRHNHKNQYIQLKPQNAPLLKTSDGLKLKPVSMNPAHTNRNGSAAVAPRTCNFFIIYFIYSQGLFRKKRRCYSPCLILIISNRI